MLHVEQVLRECNAHEFYANLHNVYLGIDIETSALHPQRGDIQVIALAAHGLPPAVLHVRGNIPSWVIDLLNRDTITLIGHNIAGFDLPWLMKYGVKPRVNGIIDTLVLEQLITTSGRRDISRNLKATLRRRLGIDISKDLQQSEWSAPELTPEQVLYSAADTMHLLQLYEAQMAEVQRQKLDEAWETERAALAATAQMSARGMPIVLDALFEYLGALQLKIVEVESALFSIVGTQFNIKSSTQTKKIFEKYGVNLQSTSTDTLINFRDGVVGEIAQKIVELRHLYKLSTYNDWANKYVINGRVYPRLWQLGTDTGRYSSADPNLQQIPREMRSIFGYPNGHTGNVIIAADYSQIEILVAAAIYGEHQLAQQVIAADVHKYVASLMFGVPIDEVTPEQRSVGKQCGFTFLFAGGAGSLIHTMRAAGKDMTYDEANHIRTTFFAALPKARTFIAKIQRIVENAQQQNRFIPIRVPKGPMRYVQLEQLKTARIVNTLIQGAAAAGLKRALKYIMASPIGQHLSLVVHDEIVVDIPQELAAEARKIVIESMQAGIEEVIGYRPRVEVTEGVRWTK